MAEFVKEYTPLSKGEEKKDTEVRIGGRIYGKVSDGEEDSFMPGSGIDFHISAHLARTSSFTSSELKEWKSKSCVSQTMPRAQSHLRSNTSTSVVVTLSVLLAGPAERILPSETLVSLVSLLQRSSSLHHVSACCHLNISVLRIQNNDTDRRL